jgi:hypothetical protein
VQQAWVVLVQHSSLNDVFVAVSLDRNRKHAARASGRTLRLAFFVNAQATRRSNSGRIYEIRLFLQSLIQNAFNGAITDQLRLPFRNMTAVAKRNLLQSAFADLRQERTQPLRQHDVGLQLDVRSPRSG